MMSYGRGDGQGEQADRKRCASTHSSTNCPYPQLRQASVHTHQRSVHCQMRRCCPSAGTAQLCPDTDPRITLEYDPANGPESDPRVTLPQPRF